MDEQRDEPGARTVPAEERAGWAGDTTIRETPGVCGGYPRIGRTRISVRNVVVIYRDTGNDFEQTVAAYPQLTREQIRAALEYYEANPARVDEDIERNARTLAELKGERWPASG